jgi:hypothetical protein
LQIVSAAKVSAVPGHQYAMARLVAGFVVAAALGQSAGAQPVTQPERAPCRVTVVLAPADVRAEIEAWVRAEPRCERELEVRVVPTDEGLYLSATDPRGRMRERVVPDAQSAAVLVVSWMADDSLGPTLPVAMPAPPHAEIDDEVPSAVELGTAPPGLARRYEQRHGERHWLTIGAIAGPHDAVGVRGQVDLLTHGRWSLGIAGGWQDGRAGGQARAVIGASYPLGPVTLRAQLGLGADVIDADRDRMEARDAMRDADDHVVPAIEASVLATKSLGDRWGLVGGPVLGARAADDHPTLSVFLGVQHGL